MALGANTIVMLGGIITNVSCFIAGPERLHLFQGGSKPLRKRGKIDEDKSVPDFELDCLTGVSLADLRSSIVSSHVRRADEPTFQIVCPDGGREKNWDRTSST